MAEQIAATVTVPAAEIVAAIGDPGAVAGFRDVAVERVIDWQARAVAVVLARHGVAVAR